ncbi:MAG TPA: hypothetical protein VHV51_09545 [Polyangiaceae bacterium]|jgi:hypothetical protein|nr:hypothetical protein [Polyangiaceae bacterium]
MRAFTVRRLALATLLPALLLFCAVPSCSNESEGERCGDDPNNPSLPGSPNDDDCESGLICVSASSLINNQANRCCNSDANVVNDSRCLRATGVANQGGSSGTGGSAGSAGSAGTGGSGGVDAGGAGSGTPDASTAAGAGGN